MTGALLDQDAARFLAISSYDSGFADGSDEGHNQGYLDGARDTRKAIAAELTRLSEDATFFADRHIYGRAARIAKEAGG